MFKHIFPTGREAAGITLCVLAATAILFGGVELGLWLNELAAAFNPELGTAIGQQP